MIRPVLAVALASALVATSLPIVGEGRLDRADEAARTEIATLERRATALVRSDDPVRGGPGARRVVAVHVPARSFATAGVEYLSIESGEGDAAPTVRWAVRGAHPRERRLGDLRLRTAEGDPLTIRRPGRHRLVLGLVWSRTEPVVTVRRFKSDDGTTRSHDRVATRT